MSENKNTQFPPYLIDALNKNNNIQIKLGILKTYKEILESEKASKPFETEILKEKTNKMILQYDKLLEKNTKQSKILSLNTKNKELDKSENPLDCLKSFLSQTSTNITSFACETSKIFQSPKSKTQKHSPQSDLGNMWEALKASHLSRGFGFDELFKDKEAQKVKAVVLTSRVKSTKKDDESIPIGVAYFGDFHSNKTLAKNAINASQNDKLTTILSKKQTEYLKEKGVGR
jgi:hypothetical protein